MPHDDAELSNGQHLRAHDLHEGLVLAHERTRLAADGLSVRLYLPWKNVVVDLAPENSYEDWVVSAWRVRENPDDTGFFEMLPERGSQDDFVFTAEIMLATAPEPSWTAVIKTQSDMSSDTSGPSALASAVLRALDKQVVTYETRALRELVPGIDVDHAGGVVPFQSEGSWNGHRFYFRYRHGGASLRVGGEDPVGEPWWSAEVEYGDSLGGSLTMEEFTYLFCYLGKQLVPAAFPYSFASSASTRRVSTAKLQDRDQATLLRILHEPLVSMGFSEEEARQNLSDWLDRVRSSYPLADIDYDVDALTLVRDDTRMVPSNVEDVLEVLGIPPEPSTKV